MRKEELCNNLSIKGTIYKEARDQSNILYQMINRGQNSIEL